MTLFGVKDDFSNPRTKYKDIFLFSTDTTIYNIPPKHIDTGKPYRHTYYFTNYNKARLFEAELWQKYGRTLLLNTMSEKEK